MIGRLGMTGASLARGDREVYKAMSLAEAALAAPTKVARKPMSAAKKAAIGAGAAAGVGLAGYPLTPPGRRMVQEARVSGLLRRSGNPQFKSLDRAGRKKMTRGLIDQVNAHKEVAKAEARKRDYSGAAVGGGAVVGAAGLAGGGIPGVKSKRIMVDVKSAQGIRAKATNLAHAYRGGEFGYRHNAHHTFKTFGLGGDIPKKATRVEHFTHGDKVGRIAAEDKIIRHLKVGRVASNVALAGGAASVAAGLHQRKKLVAKRRDDFKADALATAGGTTALGAAGASRVLNSQGRKWSKQSAASHETAQKLVPKLGGYDVRQNKTKVPDVVPHRSKMKNTVQHKTVFAGRSNKTAEAAGALKGAAVQERYFAGTYGIAAKIARKVAVGGALVGAAGLGAKALNAKRSGAATVEASKSFIPAMRGHRDGAWVPALQAGKETLREAARVRAMRGPVKANVKSPAWHVKDRRTSGGTFGKAETTMSDEAAAKLATKYDTRGPLPKKMSRESKMAAYEARYIHAGGKKGERYKRKAAVAEVGRTVGLGGATLSAAGILAHRGAKSGRVLSKVPGMSSHNLEAAGLAAATGGGASELYGAYARRRRASYANSPAGVAGSALTRMQAYTPKPKTPGAKP